MKLEEALQQLSAQLGNQFTVNENGVCSILFNKKHEVAIAKADEEGEFVYIYGRVCPFSIEERERVLLELMQSHLFGHQSHGCVFGVDAAQEYIIAFIPLLLLGIDYPAFYNTLDNLVATIEEWSQKLTFQHTISEEIRGGPTDVAPPMLGAEDKPGFGLFV